MDAIRENADRILAALARMPDEHKVEAAEAFGGMLDEIEGSFMKLPKGFDGVRIRPGDYIVETTGGRQERCVGVSETDVFVLGADGVERHCAVLWKVSPDPLVGILERFWRDTDGFEFPGDGLYPVIDEYIKEIREAVKDGG